SRYAEPSERAFFLDATEDLWSEEARADLRDDDLVVLIPAFVSSELTRAFEIGFLLYIPFLVIDLIVSNVLMAMGMMMVSPTLISIPLTIFLFVAVDGWSRLMQGLIMSYGGCRGRGRFRGVDEGRCAVAAAAVGTGAWRRHPGRLWRRTLAGADADPGSDPAAGGQIGCRVAGVDRHRAALGR